MTSFEGTGWWWYDSFRIEIVDGEEIVVAEQFNAIYL